MQVYFEEDYPNTLQVFNIIKEYKGNTNHIIFNYYLRKEICKYDDYFGLWDDFYNQFLKKILDQISCKINFDNEKNNNIKKRLLIRKLIRKYLIHIRYKPGGVKYLELLNRFNS